MSFASDHGELPDGVLETSIFDALMSKGPDNNQHVIQIKRANEILPKTPGDVVNQLTAKLSSTGDLLMNLEAQSISDKIMINLLQSLHTELKSVCIWLVNKHISSEDKIQNIINEIIGLGYAMHDGRIDKDLNDDRVVEKQLEKLDKDMGAPKGLRPRGNYELLSGED